MLHPMAWWRRRHAPNAATNAATRETFDAVIRVGSYNLPPGVLVRVAIAAVRQAVQALPGAESVCVEHHPIEDRGGAVSVFPASHSVRARELLRAHVAQVMAAAIKAISVTLDAESFPLAAAGLPSGFSDGQNFQPLTLPDPVAGLSGTSHDIDADAPSLRALTDTELLAHLLRHVAPTDSNDAPTRAMERFGSFAAVLSASEIDLRAVSGLGTHSIAAIKLMHAAALRLYRAAVMDQPHLDDSDALIAYLTAALARESIEHFRILFLDVDGRLRADEAQARGTVNHTPVYPREVVRRALELKAASIILVHNHPSGDPSPSVDDLDMTAMIEAAAEAVGVTVRDHIIVGNGRWLSFRREKLLRQAIDPPAKPRRLPNL